MFGDDFLWENLKTMYFTTCSNSRQIVLGVLFPLTGRESRKEKRIPQGKMPEPIKTSGQKILIFVLYDSFFDFLTVEFWTSFALAAGVTFYPRSELQKNV